MNGIILFDGECNICDLSVQFIMKRDPEGYYAFASHQSHAGEKILKEYSIPHHMDSLIMIDNNQCYTKSSAALRICKNLKGLWKLLYFFLLVPRPIRDFFYEMIAKNRYKWFGKKGGCMLPSPDVRERFLE